MAVATTSASHKWIELHSRGWSLKHGLPHLRLMIQQTSSGKRYFWVQRFNHSHGLSCYDDVARFDDYTSAFACLELEDAARLSVAQ